MLMRPPSIPPCSHYPAASSRCSCRSNAPSVRHSAMTRTPFLRLPSFHCDPTMTTTCSLPAPSQYPTMLALPCRLLTMLLLLKCALLQVFCHDSLSPRLSSASHHSTVLPRRRQHAPSLVLAAFQNAPTTRACPVSPRLHNDGLVNRSPASDHVLVH
jgi:hypothetical protein